MKIASILIENPFILAPLAGYTDLAFRLLCREYGAGLCYSEMISCHGLVYHQKNTLDMIKTTNEERPVVIQLFGGEPGVMGEAAAILSEYPIDLIDINMGCPVKKVTKKGAGAALMRDTQTARQIIKAVCANSQVPVTIKIRSGWNHDNIIAEDFAKMAEDNGISAIAIHARTWSDGFGGKSDWQVIAKVKKAVSIPVIGNGDIKTYQDGLNMIAETGCDGVMIGRAALGCPWVFQKEALLKPSLSYRLTALIRHLELINQFHETKSTLAKIKNHSGRYLKGVPAGSTIRKKFYATKNFHELQELIQGLLENRQ